MNEQPTAIGMGVTPPIVDGERKANVALDVLDDDLRNMLIILRKTPNVNQDAGAQMIYNIQNIRIQREILKELKLAQNTREATGNDVSEINGRLP